MTLPNVLVIGAPRSGTTSLYAALKAHPQVWLGSVKEPRFFATDGAPDIVRLPGGGTLDIGSLWRKADYLAQYAGVTTETVIGDMSPIYLRTPRAAQRIRAAVPDARIIAILRHPADRACSHYHLMAGRGLDPATTFEHALAEERARIDAGCFSAFAYRENGCYARQLDPWFALFPRTQIRIFLYDDLVAQPQRLLADLLRFIGVDDMPALLMPRVNAARMPRSRALHALSHTVPLLAPLDRRWNSRRPPPLDPATRRRLTDFYRDDIIALEALIDRDLSAWHAT